MTTVSDTTAAAYYNAQPRKRTGAGVLIFNTAGQLLIVKPTYLDRWLCPGGGIEEGESPCAAAKRECKEEIGIDIEDMRPAYINYREAQPDGQTDMVQFMFTTPPVDSDFIEHLTLQEGEIEDAVFVNVEALPEYFSPVRAQSVLSYCAHAKSGETLYMENGVVI